MRLLAALAAACVLAGCAHPLEIRNLDQYRANAGGEALERQAAIGMIVTAPDEDTLRVARGIGDALGRYSARVVQPYAPWDAGKVEVVARITATPRYEGAGSNVFVNLPGLLVLAPTWAGYSYTVGYDFQVLLTRAWDNAKLDAWTVPVSLDIRHSSGMLWATGYNREVTEPTVAQAGEPVADHVARDIVRHLNAEGRLWKLEAPSDWVPPAPPPPPPPAPVTKPAAPVPLPKPVPVTPPATKPQAAPAKPASPPPVLSPGGSAVLLAGGTIRARPTTDGAAVAIAPGTVVKLGKSIHNPGGHWWYVSADGKSGWALEADLDPRILAPAPASVAPAAAATLVLPPPAPAVPADAPPPPAAPVKWAAGMRARLKPGAMARARMAPDADPAKGFDAAATVTLKTPIKKPDGVWWYVNAPGGSGWARESDLVPAP